MRVAMAATLLYADLLPHPVRISTFFVASRIEFLSLAWQVFAS